MNFVPQLADCLRDRFASRGNVVSYVIRTALETTRCFGIVLLNLVSPSPAAMTTKRPYRRRTIMPTSSPAASPISMLRPGWERI